MSNIQSCAPGQIVSVDQLPDPQGCNPKDRPCVVIKRVGDGTLLLLVAATGEFDPDSPADDEVRLPSGNPQQPSVLGFTKPTVAKCTWLAVVAEDDCTRVGGPMATALLNAVLETTGRMVEQKRCFIVRDDRQRA